METRAKNKINTENKLWRFNTSKQKSKHDWTPKQETLQE